MGSTQQAILGFNACKPVEIQVSNKRRRNGVDYDIKVRKVTFWNVDDGKWRQEDLANKIIEYSGGKAWSDQSLPDTANDRISAWRVYYDYRAAGQSWSDTVYQEVYPADYNPNLNYCYPNSSVYHLTVL